VTAHHLGDALHDELARSRNEEAVRRNRRRQLKFRVDRYEQLKVGQPLGIIIGPHRRLMMIRFRSVLGVMTLEMDVDDAVAMVSRAMSVDVRVHERGRERSPLERD
jgi:hypothetical protein